jgi:epoxide hydrolase 4
VRALALVVLVLAAAIGVGHWSGNQPRLDAVSVAQRDLGVLLDSHSVDVGDVALHVVEAGPAGGPPVLLLHGFPEFWYAWAGVIRPLTAAGFRVILPDQRGYGDSDKPTGVEAYRIERLVADAAGLIAALGHQNAFVVAHDWGGGVAWELALSHPERVRKLAVLDTPHPEVETVLPQSGEQTTSWYRTFFQLPLVPEETARWGNWYLLSKGLRDTAKPGAFPDEKLALYRSAWDRDGAFGKMVNWYRAGFRFYQEPAEARRLRVPLLLLVAKDDAYIASDRTRASVQLCDDAELVELGSGTHWVAQEEPERIAALLVRFFGAPGNTP